MIPKYKTFPRGYEFKNFEGQPEGKLTQIELPLRVTIPLRQGFGNEVAALVACDQKVSAGEIIGRDDESVSSPVHSSVNGRVVKIEKIDFLGRKTGAVVIESDGRRDWQRLQGHSSNREDLSPEKIGELIYLSGVSSSGRAGIPTGFNSSVIAPKEVENVIIQGIESEVHNLSSAVILKDEKLNQFVQGVKVLKKVMAGARFHVALNKSHKALIKKISGSLSESDSIEICGIEPKYPLNYDEILVPFLLCKQFPYGYSAANAGVIVLDIQTILHVYEAVAEGKSLIERTVALCGAGFTENPCVKVRVGTCLEHVIKAKIKENEVY